MVGKDNSCPLTPWVYFLYPRAKGSCLTMKRGLTAGEEFWLAMSTEQEIKAEVEAPASVSIKKEGNVIEVKGTLGTIKKDFTKLPATVTCTRQQDNNKTLWNAQARSGCNKYCAQYNCSDD